MASPAARLQARLTEAKWPLPEEWKLREELSLGRAFREGDRRRLEQEADWERRCAGKPRPYLIDPLGERICEGWADLLFGEEPTIKPSDESDEDLLGQIVQENALASELQNAEEICASEREVWWRVYKDATAMGVPTIDWHSRLDLVPLYQGRTLLAVAFVSEIAVEITESKDPSAVVWRYVAIHQEGLTLNLLFRGVRDNIGQLSALTNRPETEDLQEEWTHGLPSMLCGRIVNKTASKNEAISALKPVIDFLLGLNEAFTVGQENMRLTAKKRIGVPARFLTSEGEFPEGDEILIDSEVDSGTDRHLSPIQPVELSFDAQALWLHYSELEDRALTRARLAPQLVGKGTENALTGPALRARLLDTVLAAEGKGRYWDDELPLALMAAQMVDKLPIGDGGFGHPWTDAEDPPSVERGDVLPEDLDAEQDRHVQGITAEIESRKSAIESLHPDWDEQRVDDELAQIESEMQAGLAPPLPTT